MYAAKSCSWESGVLEVFERGFDDAVFCWSEKVKEFSNDVEVSNGLLLFEEEASKEEEEEGSADEDGSDEGVFMDLFNRASVSSEKIQVAAFSKLTVSRPSTKDTWSYRLSMTSRFLYKNERDFFINIFRWTWKSKFRSFSKSLLEVLVDGEEEEEEISVDGEEGEDEAFVDG
jgi:hypothetical protein